MANPAWYNDNQFRDYPFMTQVAPLVDTTELSSSSASDGALTELPTQAVVDFGAIMEIDAEYDEAVGHYIYLHKIRRLSDVFYLHFRTNADGAYNYEVVFERDVTAEEFQIDWVSASSIVAEELDPIDCASDYKWKAFLVTGDVSSLSTLLPGDGVIIFFQGLWAAEPARVQSLMRSYLRSVTLANNPRTMATSPEGCIDSSSSAAESPAILQSSCIVGDIKWKEGYNCTIRQDTTNNAIIIGAGVGVGEGEPCEEVPLYDEETPPAGSPYLSGGPGCGEIVKSINGVTKADITILAGPGFRVQPDDVSPHKLIIDKNLDDFALCLEDTTPSLSSVSASDSSEAAMSEALLAVYFDSSSSLSNSESYPFGDYSESAMAEFLLVNTGNAALSIDSLYLEE